MEAERRKIDRLVGFDWTWFVPLEPLAAVISDIPDPRYSPVRPPASEAPCPDSKETYYVVTDDAAECANMKRSMPAVEILCNQEASNSGSVEHRLSRLSLLRLLADMYNLAECDYFVGTFSSQVSQAIDSSRARSLIHRRYRGWPTS